MKRLFTIIMIAVMLSFSTGCGHFTHSTNPAVVQAAALVDVQKTLKTVEDGLLTANKAVENLEAAEPEYYAYVKPLLKKISLSNRIASDKVDIVTKGGTADWKSAVIEIGSSVTPADLTTFGFKNPSSQLIVEGGFATLITTLETIKNKYGSN